MCGTADQGALQSLGKQILKTETEESRLGENGLPGWAGEPPHCSLPRHRRGRSKRPRCSQDGDGRKASLSSEDWKGLRDKAMRTPFSRGQAGLSQTRPNSNPFGVRFRNPHFWRVPVGFRELTEGGVDAAEDRRSLVKGNIRNEDFLTAPAGARSFSWAPGQSVNESQRSAPRPGEPFGWHRAFQPPAGRSQQAKCQAFSDTLRR